MLEMIRSKRLLSNKFSKFAHLNVFKSDSSVLARSLLAVAMPAFSCSLIVSCAAVAILLGFVAGLIVFSLLDFRSSATCSGCTVKVGSSFLATGLTVAMDF